MRRMFLLAAAVLAAAEPDPRIFRLMTPETVAVSSIDWERYEPTHLRSSYPDPSSWYLGQIDLDVRDLVRTTEILGFVIVFEGRFGEHTPEWYQARGVASPEQGIVFLGSAANIKRAMTLWRDETARNPAWVHRLRKLSSTTDNWSYARNSVRADGPGALPRLLEQWSAIRRDAVEVLAGVRLGKVHECFGTIRFLNAKAALAAADTITQLPGLPAVVEALDVRRENDEVVIRFQLPDARMK